VVLCVIFLFEDSRAAGRGRVCYEVGRSIFVNRLAPVDFRSVAYLVPPFPAFGVWRQSARHRVTLGGIGGRLAGSTGKVQVGLERRRMIPFF
jgi:hypothetical protein